MRDDLRQRADTLGGVADVPDFDVGGRDGENQTGGGAVFDRHHVVGVAFQGGDLLTRDQVPHLTGTIWGGGAGHMFKGHSIK